MILAGGPIFHILGDGIADSIREKIQSLILEGAITKFYTMTLNTEDTKHNDTKLNYTSIELSLMSLSNVTLSIMTLSIMTPSLMTLSL